MENFHAFKVVAVKQTNTAPARVKITSLYLGVHKVISYGDGTKADSMKDLAIQYLVSLGYPVLARCGTTDGLLLLSDNFKNQFQ